MVSTSDISESTIQGESRHCIILLIALAAMMLLFPIIEGFALPFTTQVLIGIFDSAILISSVVVVSRQRRQTLIIALVLGGSSTLTSWGDAFLDEYQGATAQWSDAMHLVSLSLSIVFFAFMTNCVLDYVLRGHVVTKDRLAGAVCVYLFIGILWALAYEIVWLLDPDAFRSPQSAAAAAAGNGNDPNESSLVAGADDKSTSAMLYYSFVTITTLGYGEITPVSRVARSLSSLEAITGSFYMVLLVARLVGLYNPQRLSRKGERSEQDDK